ncbi:alpha-protein kinase vwkA-like isoform X1 [Montipora capricornis]|uniref:alpha-protein kinase vwkA-like n=1 Tax=Montipora foliosa TaxID=591990 RepID=UPI0035F1CD97
MGAHHSHRTHRSLECHRDGCKYWAEFEREYFSEGSCRYAFKGKYRGNGPLAINNKCCVTKVFKRTHARNFMNWRPDLAASKKAQKFAERFNTTVLCNLRINNPRRRLNFVIPLIAQTRRISRDRVFGFIPGRRDTRYIWPQDYVAIEPFLEGHYEKFNSNGGYECDMNVSSLLPAFSHWTWHVSGHQYMVCDLQGVKYAHEYKLTDPAIHSVNREFGITDMGVIGMENVLAHHSCNDICRQLGLQNPWKRIPRMPVSGGRRTSYSFELSEEQRRRNRRGENRYFVGMPAVVE